MPGAPRYSLLCFHQSKFCRHSCPGSKAKPSLPSALSPGQVGLQNTVVKATCHSRAGKDRVKGTFDSTCLLTPWGTFHEGYFLLSAWMSRNCRRPRGSWAIESILCWEVPSLSSQFCKRAKSVWNLFVVCRRRGCVMPSVLPLMGAIWILEGSLLWHQSCGEPWDFSSYKMVVIERMAKVSGWNTP